MSRCIGKDITVTDEEYQEYLTFVRKWALKKINKCFRQMKRYARIYYGQDIFLVCYTKDKDGILHIVSQNEKENVNDGN